jgi:hypothetical protein
MVGVYRFTIDDLRLTRHLAFERRDVSMRGGIAWPGPRT